MNLTRYEALIRICDMACAHAAATQADQRPEFYDTLSAALEDDCPRQAEAAQHVADALRSTMKQRADFLKLLNP